MPGRSHSPARLPMHGAGTVLRPAAGRSTPDAFAAGARRLACPVHCPCRAPKAGWLLARRAARPPAAERRARLRADRGTAELLSGSLRRKRQPTRRDRKGVVEGKSVSVGVDIGG